MRDHNAEFWVREDGAAVKTLTVGNPPDNAPDGPDSKTFFAPPQRLQGQVLDTPCVESRTLSEIAGAQVFLKFENLQFTASFKERGACNKLVDVAAAAARRGVIAMSAGNHAQGVAYHAQRLGLPATIVMPRLHAGREDRAHARLRRHGGAARRHARCGARPRLRAGRARAAWCSCTPTTTRPSSPARARWRSRCWTPCRSSTRWSWRSAAAG